MMHCQRVQRLLGVYREIDRAEARMVDAHLQQCETCRAAWRDEQRVRKYLAGLPILETPRRLQPQLLAIPATVAAAPSLLALLMRLLGLVLLSLGLASIAGDRPVQPDIEPAGSLVAPEEVPLAALAIPLADTEAPGQADLVSPPRPAPVSRDAAPSPSLSTPIPTFVAPSSIAAMAARTGERERSDKRHPERIAGTTPTRSAGNRPGIHPAQATALADEVGPTATIPATQPPAASCPALTIRIYADVGIEGTSVEDCVQCDGLLGPADRSAWMESDHALPDGLQLTIMDALINEPLFDERVAANGQALISFQLKAADHPWICDRTLVSLRLGMPSDAFEEGWQACPRGPGHQFDIDLREGRVASFGLTRVCPTFEEPPARPPTKQAPVPTTTPEPVPSPSSTAPSATEVPAPSATPLPPRETEEPGPGAEPTGPSSGNSPDPEPGGPPSGAPSPSPRPEDPLPPPPDPPTPKPEPTTPGPQPPPPTEL